MAQKCMGSAVKRCSGRGCTRDSLTPPKVNMTAWHEDLLNLLVTPNTCPEKIFGSIERVAYKLGFDHVAYGFQAPYPVTRPKITLLNNYPRPWQEHYSRSNFLFTDPTVIYGRQSQEPLIWNDAVFASNPALCL